MPKRHTDEHERAPPHLHHNTLAVDERMLKIGTFISVFITAGESVCALRQPNAPAMLVTHDEGDADAAANWQPQP
jgi:hypothetical protein